MKEQLQQQKENIEALQKSGVTIVSTGAVAATPLLRVQYSTATAIQTSTDNWLVVGDII